MGYFGEHVGLRGDLRYLRSFQDSNTGITTADFSGTGRRCTSGAPQSACCSVVAETAELFLS